MIKFGDLQNLVHFMYQGELNVAEEDVSSFLEVANDLLVRGLSEGNVLASDSDNTQNFQNVYQNHEFSCLSSLNRHEEM